MNNLICQTAVSHILVSHTPAAVTCSVNISSFQSINKSDSLLLLLFALYRVWKLMLTISQNEKKKKIVTNKDLEKKKKNLIFVHVMGEVMQKNQPEVNDSSH